jgi:hypothetical protein
MMAGNHEGCLVYASSRRGGHEECRQAARAEGDHDEVTALRPSMIQRRRQRNRQEHAGQQQRFDESERAEAQRDRLQDRAAEVGKPAEDPSRAVD